MAPTDDEIRKMAKARVAFKTHAVAYVAVNVLLALIWWITSPRGSVPGFATGTYYWPVWTHLGWGLGLALHGFFTYGVPADWEAREEAKLREKYGMK